MERLLVWEILHFVGGKAGAGGRYSQHRVKQSPEFSVNSIEIILNSHTHTHRSTGRQHKNLKGILIAPSSQKTDDCLPLACLSSSFYKKLLKDD